MATPTQITDALQLALAAQRQEFAARGVARAAGDLDGLHAHHQAYLKACDVVSAAQAAVEGNLLNSPEALHDLELLAAANERLDAATKALAKDAEALEAFAKAAGIVIQILGALAMF